MLQLAPKSPEEVIFYDFDWGRRRLVDGETITDFGVEVVGGSVTVAASPAPVQNAGVCRVWLEGGVLGDECIVTSWVETNLNPRREFSGKLRVKTK
jgi:hypothetical protein